MKNLKLSLKKEIISSLEAKNVMGGRPDTPLTLCTPDGPDCELRSVLIQCETKSCPSTNTCPPVSNAPSCINILCQGPV